jgi:hypothetical protein
MGGRPGEGAVEDDGDSVEDEGEMGEDAVEEMEDVIEEVEDVVEKDEEVVEEEEVVEDAVEGDAVVEEVGKEGSWSPPRPAFSTSAPTVVPAIVQKSLSGNQ